MSRYIPGEIIQEPDKRLRSVSESVNVFDGEVRKIASELQAILKKVDSPLRFWLGVSAPQIGYNKRVVALRTSYGRYRIMVNPEILERKWLLPSIERCFSIEGLYFLKRYFWLQVTYQDLEGSCHEELLMGPRAVVMQQEMDHLNGKLICD